MKEEVRERLNARLGADLIRDIYFISGAVDPPHQPPPPAAPPGDDEPIELPPLRDPRLTAVLERIARAQRERAKR